MGYINDCPGSIPLKNPILVSAPWLNQVADEGASTGAGVYTPALPSRLKGIKVAGPFECRLIPLNTKPAHFDAGQAIGVPTDRQPQQAAEGILFGSADKPLQMVGESGLAIVPPDQTNPAVAERAEAAGRFRPVVGARRDNNEWLKGTDGWPAARLNHPFLSCIRCCLIPAGDRCAAVKVKGGYSLVPPS